MCVNSTHSQYSYWVSHSSTVALANVVSVVYIAYGIRRTSVICKIETLSVIIANVTIEMLRILKISWISFKLDTARQTRIIRVLWLYRRRQLSRYSISCIDVWQRVDVGSVNITGPLISVIQIECQLDNHELVVFSPSIKSPLCSGDRVGLAIRQPGFNPMSLTGQANRPPTRGW